MADMIERITEEIGTKEISTVRKLNLDNCRASAGTVEGLTDGYTSLRSLSLNNVDLRNLSSFPKLAALTKLELADNRITSGLEHLAGCPSLKTIVLNNNKIRQLKHLEPLKALAELEALDLESNPVTDEDGYPDALFELIPQLKYIDDIDRHGSSRPSDDEDDDVSEDDDSEDEEDSSDDDDEGLNESRRDLLNESTGVYAQQNVRGRLNSWSSNRSAASIEDDASGDDNGINDHEERDESEDDDNDEEDGETAPGQRNNDAADSDDDDDDDVVDGEDHALQNESSFGSNHEDDDDSDNNSARETGGNDLYAAVAHEFDPNDLGAMDGEEVGGGIFDGGLHGDGNFEESNMKKARLE